MEGLTTGITTLMGIVETMLSSILGNTVLTVIFSAGFIGLALTTLRRLIRTSKGI